MFCVMTALLVVAFVVVCALVSDKPGKKAAKERAGAARAASEVAADPLTVAYAMDRSPVSVPSDAPMREVVRVMAESDTSGVPVVDSSGVLVGFVSDGDVASYLGKNELSFFDPSLTLVRFSDEGDFVARLDDLLDLGVMSVATRRVVTVEAGDSIDDACHVLAEKRIKKVPVVQDGKLVGTLSRRNIIHAIADARGLGAAERA